MADSDAAPNNHNLAERRKGRFKNQRLPIMAGGGYNCGGNPSCHHDYEQLPLYHGSLQQFPVAAHQPPRYSTVTAFSKENLMRRLVSVVTAMGILSAQPVLAAQQCSSLTDQSAFEVQALRSELMVLATGCHEDERYNAFIRRYQPDLQANERIIDAYFKHRYGRSGQTEHDRFVTELANAMSRQGSDLGGDFCPRNGMMFNEVLALPSSSALPEYAAGKELVPTSVNVCTPTPVMETKTRKHETKHTTHAMANLTKNN